eukprot:7355230-Pyramimonas_sp.AAC.1
MAQPWAFNAFCVKYSHRLALLRMRERRALAQNITCHLARMSFPVGKDGGILYIALHNDVSIRPTIIIRVVCWVDLRTIGSA